MKVGDIIQHKKTAYRYLAAIDNGRTESLMQRAVYLYLIFYVPIVRVDTKTGKSDLTYRWIDRNAEKEFKILMDEVVKRQSDIIQSR